MCKSKTFDADLIPCPKCGGKPSLKVAKTVGESFACSYACNKCGHSTETFTDAEDAARAWNANRAR